VSAQELSRFYGSDVVADPTRGDESISEIVRLGGCVLDSAIDALGADITSENAIKVTKPGGTISNVGYHGTGESIRIPQVEWGVGMAEKTIRTSLCPKAGSDCKGYCACSRTRNPTRRG
jgi:isopropanol dehydrogenase (NADP+)